MALYLFVFGLLGALWLTYTARVSVPLGIVLMVLSCLLTPPLAWLLTGLCSLAL